MGLKLPHYPLLPLPEWCGPYIGLPYTMGGRGPHEWDCWGFAWKVSAETFGEEPPTYEGVTWCAESAASRACAAHVIATEVVRRFRPIRAGEEQPGDFVELRLGRLPLHVGIVAVPGWMLHSADGADSAAERYDEMVWRNRVIGFHRLRA